MAPLIVLRYCLAGDVEFSDILKESRGIVASQVKPLLCPCVLVFPQDKKN